VSGEGAAAKQNLPTPSDDDLVALEPLDEPEVLDPFGLAPRRPTESSSRARRPDAVTSSEPSPGPAEAAASAPPMVRAPIAATPPPEPAQPTSGPVASTGPEGDSAPAAKRRPARLRISYKKSATFLREYERNLKRGGTFIKTKTPLDVGRECVLLLTVPDLDDTIAVRGAVVWSSKGLGDLQGQEEGMGIRYDDADGEGMANLKEALAQLASD
jgi:type IV pilus assembly protein PilZ